jgi:hypothetical protein
MNRLWRHMRALWPRWTLLPPAPFFAYGAYVVAKGTLRWDHVALMLAVPLLAYGSEKTKRICVGAYPMALVGLLYDLMKLVQNVGVSVDRVHVCDLRDAELALFGLGAGASRITLHDWFLAHHATFVDVWCAIPYGTFIFVDLGFCFWLFWRDLAAMQRFAWSFFALNVAGFVTYHLYPAAPPWYFHAHGCAVDLATKASTGAALARVDELFGVRYFAGMYGRSSDVFGAVPSLHVAYPLLIPLVGWRLLGPVGRALSIAFWLTMCLAAVYLDHHWVIDVVVGLAYCVAVHLAMGLVFRRPVALEPVPAESVA